MRFHLLKQQPINLFFSKQPMSDFPNGLRLRGYLFPNGRYPTYATKGCDSEVPWKIYPLADEQKVSTGDANKCLLLDTLLKDVQAKRDPGGQTEMMWDHEMFIDIKDLLSYDKYGQLTGHLRLEAMIQWNVLDGLGLISDNDAKVQVDIVEVETKPDGTKALLSKLSTVEMSIKRRDDLYAICEDEKVGIPWSFLNNKRDTGVDTLVTITVTIPDGVLTGSYKSNGNVATTAQNILEGQVLTDVTIVTGNGTRIEAHKAFLAAKSSVFLAMFQNKMKESQDNVVELKDMSEESVKALLKYLYHGDILDAKESCVVAFELFAAGHKYEIVNLEREMRDLLLEKLGNWYNVNVAVRMFAFARKLTPEDKVLKMKAVQSLKGLKDNLMDSSDCQELFKEDYRAAMELLRYALSTE